MCTRVDFGFVPLVETSNTMCSTFQLNPCRHTTTYIRSTGRHLFMAKSTAKQEHHHCAGVWESFGVAAHSQDVSSQCTHSTIGQYSLATHGAATTGHVYTPYLSPNTIALSSAICQHALQALLQRCSARLIKCQQRKELQRACQG